MTTMTLLPPSPDVCQDCARDHDPSLPHDKQSLYYQTRFQLVHGRAPTWADALAHCDDELRDGWTKVLREHHGIDVGERWGGRPWAPVVEQLLGYLASLVWLGATA